MCELADCYSGLEEICKAEVSILQVGISEVGPLSFLTPGYPMKIRM